MNAPTTFPSADLMELAGKILSGEWKEPYGHNAWFSAEEWTSAAQYALDSNDWSEISYMVQREEAFEAFQETFSDFEGDAPDFDNWIEHGRPTLGEHLREEYFWRTR